MNLHEISVAPKNLSHLLYNIAIDYLDTHLDIILGIILIH